MEVRFRSLACLFLMALRTLLETGPLNVDLAFTVRSEIDVLVSQTRDLLMTLEQLRGASAEDISIGANLVELQGWRRMLWIDRYLTFRCLQTWHVVVVRVLLSFHLGKRA